MRKCAKMNKKRWKLKEQQKQKQKLKQKHNKKKIVLFLSNNLKVQNVNE